MFMQIFNIQKITLSASQDSSAGWKQDILSMGPKAKLHKECYILIMIKYWSTYKSTV